MKKLISHIVLSAAFALGSAAVLAGPVNINTADAPTLMAELSGVGPALAQAIVHDREVNGPFASPEALTRVKGVGPHILKINKGDILVTDPQRPPETKLRHQPQPQPPSQRDQ